MAINNIPLSFHLGGRDWKVTFHESLEKGEVDIEGQVDSLNYSKAADEKPEQKSFFGKLFG